MADTRVLEGARFEPADADGIGRLVLDRPDDPVNVLNPAFVEALAEAISVARSAAIEGRLAGLLLVSGKPGQWVAGADLKLVTAATSAAELEASSRRLQAVCDLLAWLPCPSVAAIAGPALGGGYELALACDYRVAADTPSVRVGLPEVSLGLLPAGGGTQRLPRLVGLPRALDLILAGRQLAARRALRAGLLDEVVHPAALDEAARAWLRRGKRSLNRPLAHGLSLQTALDAAEVTPAGRALMYRRARETVLRRTRGQYPAPLRALAAIQAGQEHGLAAGLDAEARAFGELALSATAHNLIWLFMASQRQKRGAIGDAPPRPVERLAVVGAGFMGAGIAAAGATAGYPVRVRDVQPDALARGLASIQHVVAAGQARRRFDRFEARRIRQRVSGGTDYSGFGLADLVIEAVFEDLPLKQRVLAEIEHAVHAETIIASNTSALPIRDIAAQATRPERVVGMHFFSPVERMPLLEVVRAARSSDRAVATAVQVGQKMGKTVIVVGDGPGFYTSRVLGVMLNEAALLLAEGARLEEVDRAMLAFGFPVGPFVLYDEVGLAVAQHAGQTLAQAFGDRYPATPVVERLLAAGHAGKRDGAGFYLWPAERPRRLPFALPLLKRAPERIVNPLVYEALGHPPHRPFGARAIQDRLALLFTNEAIRCLDEGILRSPTDGDLGAVLGLGFPPFLGGPFHYADSLGLPVLVERLEFLADHHGPRYQPASDLRERARDGEHFFPA